MIGCRPLSQEEINALIPHMSYRDATLFQLGLSTGFRISELLSIKIVDLYESTGDIKDSIQVARKNMKGKKRSRVVPIGASIQNLLKNFTSHLPATQTFLFESPRGKLSRIQAWRSIKAAAKKAQLKGKIATHSARKSLAKKAYEASGKDLVLCQHILGHSNIQSTISYLQVEPEGLSKIWKEIG